MEKMPYQDQLRVAAATIPFAWHFELPALASENVTLREVRVSDAPALLAMLTSEEVAEFVSPLPRTVEGFEDFIAEAQHERTRGNSFCFGIVPEGYDDAMGLFQVRQLEAGFGTADGDSPSGRRSGDAACSCRARRRLSILPSGWFE